MHGCLHGLMLVFSPQIYQLCFAAVRELGQLSLQSRAVRFSALVRLQSSKWWKGCLHHSSAHVRVEAQHRVCRITFPYFWPGSDWCQWRQDTSAQGLLGACFLLQKVKIQPRQLLNGWAASSGGFCSWGGWIWRSLSAGHELAVHQPQTAAHLVCSQGSSWCFPAACVAGNDSRVAFFGPCCMWAES